MSNCIADCGCAGGQPARTCQADPSCPRCCGTLDEAWKAAEAALPEHWYLRLASRDKDSYRAVAFSVTDTRDEFAASGIGPTPAAALHALAQRLAAVA